MERKKKQVIVFKNSNKHKIPIKNTWEEWKKQIFVHESNGNVKLEFGFLFVDMNEFIATLKVFFIG